MPVRGSIEARSASWGALLAGLALGACATVAPPPAAKPVEPPKPPPPTEAELRRAKETILNSFVFNYDSKEKILRQQMTYAYFGFPADYLAQYRSRIEKVTTAHVVRVAKKYVHENQMAILVVGPTKGQDRPLSSFGNVVPVDITIPKPKAPGGGASKKSAP